jgi:hypothetical protein
MLAIELPAIVHIKFYRHLTCITRCLNVTTYIIKVSLDNVNITG